MKRPRKPQTDKQKRLKKEPLINLKDWKDEPTKRPAPPEAAATFEYLMTRIKNLVGMAENINAGMVRLVEELDTLHGRIDRTDAALLSLIEALKANEGP